MYRIEIKKSALKELSQITPPYNKKIVEAVIELIEVQRIRNRKDVYEP